jgi:glycosyltransferase involved in cell wall biosynthesis
MEYYEARLREEASAIVVSSLALERRWKALHPRVVRIPNGVDAERFVNGALRSLEPVDLKPIPGPRIGYVGTVGPWIDLQLIHAVAEAQPDASVVMIGPLEREVARPAMPENVHFLGPRAYSAIPAYLAWLDVLLIPFRVTELTQAVNPVKLYEYCASGKPIAAIAIEEVVEVGDLCHVGEGTSSYLAAVEAALAEAAAPSTERIAARQALALENGWDRRVAAFRTLLDECD